MTTRTRSHVLVASALSLALGVGFAAAADDAKKQACLLYTSDAADE